MQIGMGKAMVQLGDDCFPLDSFTEVHDPLYVRMLLMESGEAQSCQRYGILSVDLTSMFPETVAEYKKILHGLADVKDENSWIAATHTFSSPHLWAVPQPGKPDIVRPGHPVRTQVEIDRCIRVNKAFSGQWRTQSDKRYPPFAQRIAVRERAFAPSMRIGT